MSNYLKTNHFPFGLIKTLTTDIKDESIFDVLKYYFMEKFDPLNKHNILVAADGALAV